MCLAKENRQSLRNGLEVRGEGFFLPHINSITAEQTPRMKGMSDFLPEFLCDVVRNVLFRDPEGDGELRIQ